MVRQIEHIVLFIRLLPDFAELRSAMPTIRPSQGETM